jgi:hypothetical protein
MKSINTHFLKSIFIPLLLFIAFSAVTQPVAPPKDPDPPGTLIHPPDQPYNGAPIDGGLVIFLSLGGIYAVKQFLVLKKGK